MNNDKVHNSLHALLDSRLNADGLVFFDSAREEISTGIDEARFSQLIALASRYARRQPLMPSPEERKQAELALAGWDTADWNLLETLRVALVLARTDLAEGSFAEAFERAFKYADEGEACAYHRAIAFLPAPQRFVWRAGEGCRSNMSSVFRATACDNPYPVQHFDDIAWQQLIMKALFIGVPLWRIYGLDRRLSETLTTMLLDYVDERTSAGRDIPADAWILIGGHWSDRAAHAVERALMGNTANRCAAALTLARAGQNARLTQWLENEIRPAVRSSIHKAVHERDGNDINAAVYQNILSESNHYAVF